MLSACVFGGVHGAVFLAALPAPNSRLRASGRACVFWVLERCAASTIAVEGRERIPPGNHIVMSNHTSAWETIAHFLMFPPQVWVLKRELLWIPFVGWGTEAAAPHRHQPRRRPSGREPGGRTGQGTACRMACGSSFFRRVPGWSRARPRKFGVSGALLATATGKLLGAAVAQRRRVLGPARHREEAGHGARDHRRTHRAAGKDPRELNEEVRQAIDAGLARIASTPN